MRFEDGFVHLHLHSAFSLAEGAIRTKDIIELCNKFDMPAAAVTDTNNLFGALEFAQAGSKSGIQPIIGCQVDVGHEYHQLVLLCQSEAGYRNLCKIISDAFMEGDPAQKPHTTIEALTNHAEGLICLSGGSKGAINQYLAHNQKKPAEESLKRLKKIFGDRFYIELQRHGWPEEDQVEPALIDLAYKHEIPLVATNDCYFPKQSMHEAHDALLCIAEGRYVTESDRRTVTPEHYFKSAREMKELFSDIPEAIKNTIVIAQRCHFVLEAVPPMLPKFETDSSRTENEEMKEQSEKGLQWRLDNFVFTKNMDEAKKAEITKEYQDRLAFELNVISEMGFPGYFLIVSDFIKWAKEQKIPVGPGRGSGAGSLVAWSLKITDLDPIDLGLLFERFLNPERVSMPDFDIDFCQDRREEVIRYVQDKYGHDRVAQIITFGKLQARAVVRDVGRVLQMPYGQVDRISKMIPSNPAAPVTLQEALIQDEELRNARRNDESTDKLITLALQLEGLYRHASTHAAGVVIGDRPLHELVPLYRDPRSDMPVTQFNMKYVEQTGLVKFDFLGLKTMTVIQKAVDMIKETKGEDIDILRVPLDDQATYDLMSTGDTVGVFQLESAGMRDAMKRMKPNRFEDIIALVALYRPGPMDNIPTYIDRKFEREVPDYMHEKLKPYLEETYGIMIYQEQVMQAAQALSGYSLGAADLLRRAMGKKIQSEMDEQREMFMKGAKEHNNVPEAKSSEIFDQIAKFAGYGFNKSHAAAYALIAYWTGWLKANYPSEFMAASMTLDMGNTEKLAIFKQDLDRLGIPLLPPDINESIPTFRVGDDGVKIHYALAALKGVGAQAMQNLVTERSENGPFSSLNDLAKRIDTKSMNKRQYERLAASGAFDSLHPDRAQAYQAGETLLKYAQTQAEERESGQVNLFGGGNENTSDEHGFEMPDAEKWDPLETLKFEFDAVGFYLSAHPLDSKKEQLERLDIVPFMEIEEKLSNRSQIAVSMAGVLIKKQIKVSPKSGNKYAFLQLSDSSGVYEVVLFSELLARTNEQLIAGETMLLKVVAEQKEDQIRFTVQNIQPLELALSKKVKEIHIYISSAKAMPKLKECLDLGGRGPADVKLMIDVSPRDMAEVILEGSWTLSAQARSQMLKQDGIESIQEL